MVNRRRMFFYALASGIALALPFLHYNLGWLVFVSLLPFLVLNKKLIELHTKTFELIFWCWLSGFVMMLIVVSWLAQVDAGLFAGEQGWTIKLGVIITYIGLALTLSSGFVLIGLAYSHLPKRVQPAHNFFLLPSIWVAAEYLRSVFYSIIMVGDNSTIGPYWNFGVLGFAASSTPFVYSSRLLGLYGLSFLVVAFNIAIFYLIYERRTKLFFYTFIALFILCNGGYWGYRDPNGPEIKVSAIQTTSKDESSSDKSTYHFDQDVSAVILPEYYRTRDGQTTIDVPTDAIAVSSRERQDGEKKFNTLTVYDKYGTVLNQQDKQFLIPIGETMPYVYEYIFTLLGQGNTLDAIKRAREVSKGGETAKIFEARGVSYGLLVCSGIMAPSSYRELTHNGAEVLTNSASLFLFEKAPIYHQQAQQMVRFLAVSNARPFVQATKGGFTEIMDHNGRIIGKTGRSDPAYINGVFNVNNKVTPYSVLGEWVLYLSMISTLGLVLVKLKRKYKS